ncbi:quinolinate synthetase complex, A subunit [Lachnospiraceae bacterium 3-1]|jgi:quinolinate synthase|nr:quinolinate synthetase complex, A subunit [Lachnospiraceae bacterium 3-1]
MEDSIKKEIEQLKRKKDVVILAHYYVDGQVQELADFVGDSYFLAKKATEVTEKNILFCGVSFMGESAKILNPGKRVVMADGTADCPMAHMLDIDRIAEVRREYADAAVVCYVNSTAEIKAYSDVCVTSSNALRVVRALPNRNIFFVPDENLGRYIASQIPEKNFILNDGFCHVHTSIYKEELLHAKELHPDALVLSHPECRENVLEISDFIGSTSEILSFAERSEAKEFIICTEMGVFYELELKNPNKKFYSVGHRQFCPNMKKISLEKVLYAMETLEPVVEIDEKLRIKAAKPLSRMLELAK